jgi:hypothetical protein
VSWWGWLIVGVVAGLFAMALTGLAAVVWLAVHMWHDS